MAKNQGKKRNTNMSDYTISDEARDAFENADYFVTSQPSEYYFV